MLALLIGIAVAALPLILVMVHKVSQHRTQFDAQLALAGFERPQACSHTVILPVPAPPNRVVLEAVEYAKSMSNDVLAVHVRTGQQDREELQASWKKFVADVPLIVLNSPRNSVLRPLLRFIDEIGDLRSEHKITVVLPEIVPERWWQHLLHNQTSLLIKQALLFRHKIIVTSVPYHMRGGMRRRPKKEDWS